MQIFSTFIHFTTFLCKTFHYFFFSTHFTDFYCHHVSSNVFLIVFFRLDFVANEWVFFQRFRFNFSRFSIIFTQFANAFPWFWVAIVLLLLLQLNLYWPTWINPFADQWKIADQPKVVAADANRFSMLRKLRTIFIFFPSFLYEKWKYLL